MGLVLIWTKPVLVYRSLWSDDRVCMINRFVKLELGFCSADFCQCFFNQQHAKNCLISDDYLPTLIDMSKSELFCDHLNKTADSLLARLNKKLLVSYLLQITVSLQLKRSFFLPPKLGSKQKIKSAQDFLKRATFFSILLFVYFIR